MTKKKGGCKKSSTKVHQAEQDATSLPVPLQADSPEPTQRPIHCSTWSQSQSQSPSHPQADSPEPTQRPVRHSQSQSQSQSPSCPTHASMHPTTPSQPPVPHLVAGVAAPPPRKCCAPSQQTQISESSCGQQSTHPLPLYDEDDNENNTNDNLFIDQSTPLAPVLCRPGSQSREQSNVCFTMDSPREDFNFSHCSDDDNNDGPSTGEATPTPVIREASNHPDECPVQWYGKDTGITNWRKHLKRAHLPEWIARCDTLSIIINAKTVIADVEAYCKKNSIPAPLTLTKFEAFLVEGMAHMLMELVVANDLSISFVESKCLICLLLYLRHDIDRSNILGLYKDLIKALRKVSFTCDGWTDCNLYPFMAITAHWIQEVVITERTSKEVESRSILKSHAEVIAFHKVPVSHTGAHLTEAFLYLLNHVGILKKVSWITCDNVTNNDVMLMQIERHLKALGVDFDEYKNHLRCFAHILHLAIMAILAKMDLTDLVQIYMSKDSKTLLADHDDHLLT
uniref:Uncharacterized protein n=1 Tax=Moniliophthora roreri TaxID=221103 RepID=A0A0W0F504_MONRR